VSLMLRRSFLKSAAATVGSLGLTQAAAAQTPSTDREYYILRRYSLVRGLENKVLSQYFAHALVPALNRLGITRVGVFSEDVGPELPAFYVIIPSNNLSLLVSLETELQKDAEFVKAAEPYWSASAATPAYERIESSLLGAFHGWPKLTPPPTGKHILQLRTYESPSDAAHIRKIEMFHSGEYEIFARAGAKSVFYGDVLVGPHMPCLTYMLSFADMNEMNASWDRFLGDPQWKKLTAEQRFSYEEIVSRISNLVLHPVNGSQI
jgi:hypothetical protein